MKTLVSSKDSKLLSFYTGMFMLDYRGDFFEYYKIGLSEISEVEKIFLISVNNMLKRVRDNIYQERVDEFREGKKSDLIGEYFYDFEKGDYSYVDYKDFIHLNLLNFAVRKYEVFAQPFQFYFFSNNDYIGPRKDYSIYYAPKLKNIPFSENKQFHSDKLEFMNAVYDLVNEYYEFKEANFETDSGFKEYMAFCGPRNHKTSIPLNSTLTDKDSKGLEQIIRKCA